MAASIVVDASFYMLSVIWHTQSGKIGLFDRYSSALYQLAMTGTKKKYNVSPTKVCNSYDITYKFACPYEFLYKAYPPHIGYSHFYHKFE